MSEFKPAIDFIKSKFPGQEFIPLHEPKFIGNEKKYLLDTIDSTFVSSVGAYVNKVEAMVADITGSRFAVATVSGTAALHISLLLAGVTRDDEVLTQALTFVATVNAVSYIGATPVFIDVDLDSMGLSARALEQFLNEHVEMRNGKPVNRATGKRIAACLPMHTFGMPCDIAAISSLCAKWGIALIEDCAESFGSYIGDTHCGQHGLAATLSFNGNKTVTCGGGGAIFTNDADLAKTAKHLTTQAKVNHAWAFEHDMVGYNYRMPNLNAALACAQFEMLPTFLESKRLLASEYAAFFETQDFTFKQEPPGTRANYWLNAIQLRDRQQRDSFLQFSNDNGVMCRPVWNLMTSLKMYSDCQHDGLENSRFLEDRIVNIPSSVRISRQ